MFLVQNDFRQPIFTAFKELQCKGIDAFLNGEWLGFDGREKVFIYRMAQGYAVEYLVGIRTSPWWTEKEIEELKSIFTDHGWTVGAGILVWKKFSVSRAGDFYEALEHLSRTRCFIAAYTETYNSLCVGKSWEERPSVSDLMDAVKAKYAANKKELWLEKRHFSLDEFEDRIVKKGFVRQEQGAG